MQLRLADSLPQLGRLARRPMVSLFEMLSFKAIAFYDTTAWMTRLEAAAAGVTKNDYLLDDERHNNVIGQLEHFGTGCELLGAKSALRHTKRVIDSLRQKKATPPEIEAWTKELASRFRDDIELQFLFVIAPDDVAYYENAVGLFGAEVVRAFPSAVADLEEAGKCLALDRTTASAFHLMRALEVPIQILAKQLVPDDPKPNWDPVLKKIDAELKKPHSESAFKGQIDFYSHVSAHMHAVKLAWRNRVAHIDPVVPPEKAREIFAATRALLRYLADHLAEVTNDPASAD